MGFLSKCCPIRLSKRKKKRSKKYTDDVTDFELYESVGSNRRCNEETTVGSALAIPCFKTTENYKAPSLPEPNRYETREHYGDVQDLVYGDVSRHNNNLEMVRWSKNQVEKADDGEGGEETLKFKWNKVDEEKGHNYRMSGEGLPVCSPTTCDTWEEDHHYLPLMRPAVLQNRSGLMERNGTNRSEKCHILSEKRKISSNSDFKDYCPVPTNDYVATEKYVSGSETAVKTPYNEIVVEEGTGRSQRNGGLDEHGIGMPKTSEVQDDGLNLNLRCGPESGFINLENYHAEVESNLENSIEQYQYPLSVRVQPTEFLPVPATDLESMEFILKFEDYSSYGCNQLTLEEKWVVPDFQSRRRSISLNLSEDISCDNNEIVPSEHSHDSEEDFRDDKSNYKSMGQEKVGKPPQVIQEWLDRFCVNRKFAVINPGTKGGAYNLDELGLSVTVPEQAIPDHYADQKFLFVNSKNQYDFPEGFKCLSDVYHFLPHDLKLQKRIMLSFPLTDVKSMKGIAVMYSNTDHITKPAWRKIKVPSPGEQVAEKDEVPFVFFADQKCYLFLNHFCLFTVVLDDNGIPYEAFEVHVTMNGIYNPVSGVLQLTCPIQINQKKPPFPKLCMGEMLDEDSFFLKKDAPLDCELEILEGWEILNKKIPSKSALQNMEKMGSGPLIKISLQLHDTLTLDEQLPCKMVITQGDQQISLFNDAKVLKELIAQNTASPEKVLADPCNPGCSSDDTSNSHTAPAAAVSVGPIAHGSHARKTYKFSNDTLPRGVRLPVADGGNERINTPDVDDDDLLNQRMQTIPINNIIPHIQERHWLPEPVLPEFLEKDMCSHLNDCQFGQEGWKDLLGNLGREDLCEVFKRYENPTHAVLEWWQSGRNLWSDFADRLRAIRRVYLAEEVERWRCNLEAHRNCYGSDQTVMKR